MNTPDLSSAQWKKSSHSDDGGCVEVAKSEQYVAVRDTKDRGGPALVFTPHEWRVFLAGVRDSEFDL